MLSQLSFVITLDDHSVCLKNILETDFSFKFALFCCFLCSYCHLSWYKPLNRPLVISGLPAWSKLGITFYCTLRESWRALCYKGRNWLLCHANCSFFFGFYFLHSLSSTNRICRYCVRETIYVEESSAINNNRDITKISLLCNIWCCVATGQRKYQDGRIAWCALPSFLGGETLNGAKTLKVWRIRQSPSFLMINVFHYPWLNRVQANEDSLICITAELRLKARSTGSV